MNADDVRRYVARDWHLLSEMDRDHWARESASRGPLATLEASQALWRHMREVRPDWPDEENRRDDLARHIALKQAIDRAASVCAAPSGR